MRTSKYKKIEGNNIQMIKKKKKKNQLQSTCSINDSGQCKNAFHCFSEKLKKGRGDQTTGISHF